MLLEISRKSLVDEFASIIEMKNFYLGRKLSLNYGMKCLKNRENFAFSFQMIEPRHSSTIINKNYKPMITR